VKLAIIVPVLDEAPVIAATLRALRAADPTATIVVVDGGSRDGSCAVARPLCDRLIEAPRGRAVQMNAGAATAAGADVFAFVHADTRVPITFARAIEQALSDPRAVGGRFDLDLDDPAWRYRMLAALINLRSRLMRSATGDQAIFVRRDSFVRLGGFREIDLCEDVDFVRRLRRCGRLVCLRERVVTSARRWRRGGFLRTILRMWIIKSLFLAGASPAWLRRHYVDAR